MALVAILARSACHPDPLRPENTLIRDAWLSNEPNPAIQSWASGGEQKSGGLLVRLAWSFFSLEQFLGVISRNVLDNKQIVATLFF